MILLKQHCFMYAVDNSTVRIQESIWMRFKQAQAFGAIVHIPELHSWAVGVGFKQVLKHFHE